MLLNLTEAIHAIFLSFRTRFLREHFHVTTALLIVFNHRQSPLASKAISALSNDNCTARFAAARFFVGAYSVQARQTFFRLLGRRPQRSGSICSTRGIFRGWPIGTRLKQGLFAPMRNRSRDGARRRADAGAVSHGARLLLWESCCGPKKTGRSFRRSWTTRETAAWR